MPRADNRYSQFVSFAKITLPIFGLAVLSSLFLLSGDPDNTGNIPYSEVELEEIISGQRVGAPDYKTVLSDGSELEVSAETARPDLTNPSRFFAEEITARMIEPGGAVMDLRAASGVLDQGEDKVSISGGVRFEHSSGYVATSTGASARLDGQEAQTDGPVLIRGPELTITADQGRLVPTETDQRPLVVFSGNVKLIYTPQ